MARGRWEKALGWMQWPGQGLAVLVLSFINSEDAAGVWEAGTQSGSVGPGVREEQEHGDGKRLMPSV